MASDNNNESPSELNAEQAAAYCGYTLNTFYLKVKQIRHRKERGLLYFTVASLDEFKAAQSTEHVPTVFVP